MSGVEFYKDTYIFSTKDLSLENVVSAFESGQKNIYIKNEDNTWDKKIISKQKFSYFIDKFNDSWEQWVDELQPEMYVDAMQVDDIILQQAERIIKEHQVEEVPVVSNGKIQGVYRKAHPKYNFRWECNDVFIRNAKKYFASHKRICISTINNSQLYLFYQFYSPLVSIEVLNHENVNALLNRKYDLFISECCSNWGIYNSLSLRELHDLLLNSCIEDISNRIWYTSDFPVCTYPVGDYYEILRYFDAGYPLIILQNEEYVGCIYKNSFLDMIYSDANFVKKISVKKSVQEIDLNKKIARLFFESNLEQIPICMDGMASQIAMISNTNNKVPLAWNSVNTYLHKSLDKKKVMLSSLGGELSTFYNRYKDEFDITLFNKDNLSKKMSGYYDLFIHGDSNWERDKKTHAISIEQLYLDVLSNSVYDWIANKGVRYFYFEIPLNVNDASYRVSSQTELVANRVRQSSQGYYKLCDLKSENCNIIEGIRHTKYQSKDVENIKKKIYILGPCTASGLFASDENTIASFLQKLINESKKEYHVVNLGVVGSRSTIYNDINSWHRLMDQKISDGDIVVHLGQASWIGAFAKNIKNYYVSSSYFNQNSMCNCFILGDSAHFDWKGNKIFAEKIFETIFEDETILDDILLVNDLKYESDISINELDRYFERIEPLCLQSTENMKIGSIVMNGNPFTKGHKYLVEYALARVDYLYIFIVEEDLSDFTFEERYRMASLCFGNNKRVSIVPSGKFIISQETFSEYFSKNNLQDNVIVPVKDVEFFGKYIAPKLGISYRFVGQEPYDNVTKQYNDVLKSNLSKYDVKLIEIERLKVEDRFVSATFIRKNIYEGKVDNIKEHLPQEVYEYLIKLQHQMQAV